MASSLVGDTLTTGKIILSNTTSNDDAFDRLRVSVPYTLYDFNSIMGKMPTRMAEQTGGNGAAAFVSGESYIAMTVDTSGSSYVIRQSKQYIPYLPGKSKLVIMSGVLLTSASTVNVVARLGSFDTNMGHFYQMQDGVMSVVERKAASDTVVNRSSWNIDKLDGTGVSKLHVDFTKAIIFNMDQEWLGVGKVRMGVMVGGLIYYCHYFLHDPLTTGGTAITEPYYQFATLPVRYEIRKTAGGGTSGQMNMMCGTVQSEGGYLPILHTYSSGMFITPVALSASAWQPVLSITLLAAGTYPYNHVGLRLRNIAMANNSNNSLAVYQLVVNPVFAGTDTSTYTAVGSDSAAQIRIHDTTATVSSWDFALTSGYIGGAKDTTISLTNDEVPLRVNPVIGTDVSGNPETFTLVAKSLVGGASLAATFDWYEYI